MTHLTKTFSLTFLCFILFLGCKKLESDKVLEHKIKQAVTKGKPTVLDLNAITDFEWNEILILTPYTNPKEIENNLGIDLSSIKHSGIQSRDDINLILFLKDKDVVRMVEYPRYPGDFKLKTNWQLIPKSRSKFRIVTTNEKTSEGYDWIVLEKQ